MTDTLALIMAANALKNAKGGGKTKPDFAFTVSGSGYCNIAGSGCLVAVDGNLVSLNIPDDVVLIEYNAGQQIKVYGNMTVFHGYNASNIVSVDLPVPATCSDISFEWCRTLQSIPAGMFDKATSIENFDNCFTGCSSLTTIPPGLFKNSAASSFQSCFDSSGITEIPADTFEGCSGAADFTYCFARTPITSIPAGLFDDCGAAKIFERCFYECQNLETIPADLFENTIAEAFLGCFAKAGLKSIPGGLFRNCHAATSFYACFQTCLSLQTIQAGLFDGCAAAEDFGSTFEGCSQITSAVPELWDSTRWPNVTVKGRCYNGCQSAANYADIPSGWK